MLGHVVVFHGSGQPLTTVAAEVPAVGPGEVLVRVRCCTLCSSDLHTYAGRRSTPVPTVLGHEILGTVVGIGSNTPGAPPIGRRVTWTVTASCGQCFFCHEHLPQKCDHLFKYGHEAIDERQPFSGGLAEYCLLRPGTTIVEVPDNVPDALACPANCATATVAAALRTAGSVKGRSVLIQGAGVLGLSACALARHQGASEVICSDVDSTRLQRALAFGATHLVSAARNEAMPLLKAVTGNRGVDVALEISGAPDAIESGIDLLRIGGRYILVGSVMPTRSVSLLPEQVVRRMLSIQGVHNYVPGDLQTAVAFLSATQSHYPWQTLIGPEFPLAQAEQAFQAASAQPGRRVLVRA